ncbi:reverse transcriptase [Gossypium australe]|uniref:Reverse transcriptase n=1 Tax=Gossypium australe TaxID=47621 RepID=A0A5B6WH59_9ROSI|nr:reverse transcriptase [Gossypium australe]
MVFLMETKVDSKRMERIRRRSGFENGIDVGAEGSRGGLCLVWREDFRVSLKTFSKIHINVKFEESNVQGDWRYTGFYGSHYANDQHASWRLLRALGQEQQFSWLVSGDFNEILYSFEKSGGQLREERRMVTFREVLEDCQLMDLGFQDHCPLLINTGYEETFRRRPCFKFKARWTLEESFEEEIRKSWESSTGTISEKLGRLQSCLTSWASLIRCSRDRSKKELTKELGILLDVLQSPYSVGEIQKALKGMDPTKAPSYDGFLALFFQKYWHIVGKDVEEFCLGVLNEGKDLDSVNRTDNVLIPKTLNATNLVNFRPISLCTILYKLVAKTIANRMQDFIGQCIDSAQSAFVPGRLILDNVLIAYEILHTLRQKHSGKKGFMAVKLDMSKAYDRVEWSYLKEVMLKMGFDESWVELIMKCISTVSYIVNINRNRGRLFYPTRGLRQGDPLSPYLFLIFSEGLSALIRQAVGVGNLRGVKESRRGPEISHLLFANDCLLFGEATKERVSFLKETLKQYEQCSGQCVNFNKSTIFFSSNTLEGVKWETSEGWRIMNNADSLVAKVLKAKYFPNDQFLNSRLGNSSSYTWKSIWAAKDVLRKGLVWHVDTARILRISLASSPHEDLLAWGGEASGEFSVRSAYKLLQNTDDNPRAYALQTSYRKLYKKLWLLNLPTKIKITIWKITWNFLPTRVNLQHKKLLADPSCPRCGERAETIDHLFRECPVTVEIWSILLFRNVLINDNGNFEQWLIWAFEQFNTYNCQIFCCALWAIWGDQNSRIHNKKVSTGTEIEKFIKTYMAEIDGLERKESGNIDLLQKWNHPPLESVKINFDGAFDGHNKISASGIVVRDNEGSVLEAVQIGVEHTWPKIIIEGDSLTVIKMCQNRDRDRSMIGAYIQDIQTMASRSKKFDFKHVSRIANTLAHNITTEELKRKEGIYQGRSGPEQNEYQRLRGTL